MINRFRLNRRTLLRGMLGGGLVTVGLPMFEAFVNTNGTAMANGDAFPTRFGMFFWGNGMLPDRWVPQGTGSSYTLSEQLQPLAPVRDAITIITNMQVRVPNQSPHGSGPAGLLSGMPSPTVDASGSFAGPTIDQRIAAQIGDATRFRSIEFGAEPESGLSWSSPTTRNPAERSPYALFERLFGPGFRAPGEEAIIDPSIALRRSVLDVVSEDANRLRNRLGTADQARLDSHLTAIRELELRLARLEEDPPTLAACLRPEAPLADYPWINGRPQLAEVNRVFGQICAMALACDQTRVFSNFISFPVNNLLFEGATAGHHQLTHDEPGEQPQVNEIVIELMGHFAEFIQELRNIPEGDGTVLDHCAVLGTSDVSYGRTHSIDEYPLIIAGSASGRLRTGIHYRPTGADNASKVILTLMRAVGVTAASYGEDDAMATDSVSEVEA
jgi:hypothetical protein